MKTISIDIPDKLYDTFKAFLNLLNKEDVTIYTDDIEVLTPEEKKCMMK